MATCAALPMAILMARARPMTIAHTPVASTCRSRVFDFVTFNGEAEATAMAFMVMLFGATMHGHEPMCDVH